MNVLRVLARAGVRLFFTDITVLGREQVPGDGPLLVVSNHTNGLADGLVLLDVLPRSARLTAKSTLAKNPLLRLLMLVGGVVPFYRTQDSADTRRNTRSFDAIRHSLSDGDAICIFPEGVSHSDASMRELKTGAARIALGFASASSQSLRIVPVGLHYESKGRFRSSLLVRIGSSLDVSEWLREHKADAHELTTEIDTRIRALTSNFRRVREALWLRWIADLLSSEGEDPAPLGQDGGELVRRVSLVDELRLAYDRATRDDVATVFTSVRSYRRDLRRLGIAQHEVYLSMQPARAVFFVLRELELLIVGGWIAAAGAVQHGLAFLADLLLTRKLSVDADHWAANAIFYGFVLFPLTWIVGAAVAWKLGSMWVAIAYAVLLPFTLVYLVLYGERAARAFRRARTFLTFLFRPALQHDLQQRGKALIADIERRLR